MDLGFRNEITWFFLDGTPHIFAGAVRLTFT